MLNTQAQPLGIDNYLRANMILFILRSSIIFKHTIGRNPCVFEVTKCTCNGIPIPASCKRRCKSTDPPVSTTYFQEAEVLRLDVSLNVYDLLLVIPKLIMVILTFGSTIARDNMLRTLELRVRYIWLSIPDTATMFTNRSWPFLIELVLERNVIDYDTIIPTIQAHKPTFKILHSAIISLSNMTVLNLADHRRHLNLDDGSLLVWNTCCARIRLYVAPSTEAACGTAWLATCYMIIQTQYTQLVLLSSPAAELSRNMFKMSCYTRIVSSMIMHILGQTYSFPTVEGGRLGQKGRLLSQTSLVVSPGSFASRQTQQTHSEHILRTHSFQRRPVRTTSAQNAEIPQGWFSLHALALSFDTY